MVSTPSAPKLARKRFRDYFGQKPLRDRLVIAYLIGAPVPLDVFERVLPDIPLCESATQTLCIVTYNTFEEDAEVRRFERRLPVPYPGGFESIAGRKLACVNPLTWTTDEKRAPSSQHEGGVLFTDDGAQPAVQPAFVSAHCQAGLLRINEPPDRRFRIGAGRLGDYHLVDYSLFYMNLRRNVETRVSAFVAR